MQEFLDVIREECSPQTWSRGVQLARRGKLAGKQNRDGEYELRLSTAGGMVSPRVTLIPDDEDWSCECPSTEGACQHVAGAAIALAQALKDGEDLAGVRGPGATVAYRLRDEGGKLSLTRFLKQGEQLTPLKQRLAADARPPEQRDVAATRDDLEIDISLGAQLSGVVPRPLMASLLERLARCDDVQLEGQPVEIGEPVTPITARVVDERGGFRLFAEADPAITRTFENGALLRAGQLCAVAALGVSDNDVRALRRGRRFSFDQAADLAGRVIPALQQSLTVQVDSRLLPGARPMPARLSLQSELVDGALEVLPTIVYGDPPCARVDGGRLHHLQGDLPLRDTEQEQRLARLVERRLGLSLGRRRRLAGEEAVALGERVSQLSDVHLSGGGLAQCSVRGALSARLDLTGDRFAARFETAEGEGVSAEAVLRAWQLGSPLVALDDGGFAPLPADFLAAHGHLLLDLLTAREQAGDGALPRAALPDLARLCAALDHPPPPALEGLRGLLGDFTGIPRAARPSDLTATLRDYQQRGVDWLSFLSDAGLGALLADDMGLGKTLQALCALRAPALVVCPASVLFNWRRELERFRPGLRVHTYHGPARALDEDADVTLTTYAILRIDRDPLAARRWDTVVLDEAQTIKNADSQVAQAAFALSARFRVALTGTPVENRLEDLWSQLHFLNRGLLGGRADFQERYARPISEGDQAAAARLRARIKPFVLRRVKREVAKELPPRTEVVLRCTLDEQERALYDSVRLTTQREVVAQLEAGGSVMAALEALLRLRQACCHRALLPGQDAPGSSKLALLMETLDEALSAGHKALVFSQWTSLLDLLEPHLQRASVGYNRLDGSTRDREGVVAAFQERPEVQVMLLSLKAGGTGLNLTAADHVFLLDPWWNPAVEDQAADRAHRIGQDRPVLVHRLVAADSVEERILELQRHKRSLAQAATGGGAAAASLSRDDLLALLR